MGKVVEKKRKKKKGRPSLIDLQKRTLKQTNSPILKNPNSNPNNYKNATPPPFRRSTRRNPNFDDEDSESSGKLRKKREKKLKLVLKLHSDVSNSDDDDDDDDLAEKSHKKRKINAIGDGSTHKEENPSVANTLEGTVVEEDGPMTPLPDKKLLEFVLDRLQKKDTYGVFSEPVDPNELPDYHEIIDNPMDFGTVRKKLADGAYANLEQFERDIYLICSNAMEYNAPDTVYFRQARSIHELAKKNFENLRQDSDDNEPEPKAVRRGRPPTKNLKKAMGRPALECGSEFPSDAAPPTGGEISMWSNYDLRRGIVLEKPGLPDSAGRSLHGSRNSEACTGWSAEHKFERNDELTGSRGKSYKYGKKQPVHDDERRNTYGRLHPSAGIREPSVLATFDGEKKMLLPVGLHSEHGYARSLARFAANLGPVAWKIASRKIEKSLPAGVKFGLGWVGEKEVETQRPVLLPLDPSSQPLRSHHLSPFGPPSILKSQGDRLSNRAEGENLLDKHVQSPFSALDSHLNKILPPSTTITSTAASIRSPEPAAECAEAVKAQNSNAGFNALDSSHRATGSGPPLQIHQGPMIRPGMNGINGVYGYDLQSQTGKLVGATRPTSFNLHSPRMLNSVPRTSNNIVSPVSGNCFNSEGPERFENPSTVISGSSRTRTGSEGLTGLQPHSTLHGLSHPKQDSVPPDLNVIFQTPGSPSSTRVDSTQPDLALQL